MVLVELRPIVGANAIIHTLWCTVDHVDKTLRRRLTSVAEKSAKYEEPTSTKYLKSDIGPTSLVGAMPM